MDQAVPPGRPLQCGAFLSCRRAPAGERNHAVARAGGGFAAQIGMADCRHGPGGQKAHGQTRSLLALAPAGNLFFGCKLLNNLDISMFKNDLLDKLKNYAIKLSEDFPNFIRVDLYLFHDKIYLSELTFDSQDGFPFMRDYEIIKNAAKNWKRIE